MFELTAAGIEAGSKRTIMEEWTLVDVADLREHWRTCGPPAHIALAAIAASLGNVLTTERETEPSEAIIVGPSIAEMAAMATPFGDNTMGASIRILEQLKAQAREAATA